MNRSRQYLRWFGPAVFDYWGYIDSFSYMFEPKRIQEPQVKLPPGWESCGQLKGEMIGLGPVFIRPGDSLNICAFVPLGGQHKPTPYPYERANEAAVYFETTFTDPFVGGTYWGAHWRPYNVDVGDGPQIVPGGVKTGPVATEVPWTGLPAPRPGSRPRTVPFDLQPDQPVAPSPVMGPTRSYGGQFDRPNPDKGVGPLPNGDRPVAPENPHVPPGPRTKERKGKVPKWFAALSRTAWEATEAVDVVDNLFECLPKKVQKKAPKTGVTMPDAWKPGIKYTSVIDRAKHVYNNVDQLDLDCAMRKLACNHIMDMLWGRFFGGVDNAAQKAGLKGFGRAAGSSGGLNVTKEQRAAFDEWISSNPALDSIRKSLDCENLGRS